MESSNHKTLEPIRNLMEVLEVPYITLFPYSKPYQRDNAVTNGFSIEIQPGLATLIDSVTKLIKKLEWKEFGIIYDNEESM